MYPLRWKNCRMERTDSMRKGVIKSLVLIAVFCLTVVVTSFLTHKNNIDLTTTMAEASLPMVYLQENDTDINELYGYTAEMDGTKVRDAIAPLGEDLKLPVTIKVYQNQIESISYEVRMMDMERLMEEDKIDSFSQKDGKIYLSLQLQNILEEEQEYMLVLKIRCDGKDVYYYTRIIRDSNYYVKESVDFVMNFHKQTFEKDNSESLATYLEPNDQGDNTTLQKVTINSSLNQVTWAEFQGKPLEIPVPSIKEIGSFSNTIVLDYVLTAPGEDGSVEYYNVEEYYRVRYSSTNNRMHLLNYERTMNELFRGENGSVKNGGISLGIRSQDVEYMSNERGSVVAFVQEGELWSYSSDSSQLSRIYGFRSAEGIEERENNDQHQIKIIKIDETGTMDFVVYGYMNRGIHEGRTGIGVFHYDSVGDTVEEELFVPSNKSFEVLNTEWGNIFYVSDGNIFYLLADDSLYCVDLYSRESRKVVTGLEAGRYAVSENGRFIAWQDSENRYSAKSLHVMDLEGEEMREIKAEKGECLLPIGFLQNDFVYGAAKETDIVNDEAGNTQFPMYRILVVDEKSVVEKEYHKDGYYVSRAYVENETVFLDQVYHNGTGYVPADRANIKNYQLESTRLITVETVQTELKQCQINLKFAEEGEEIKEPVIRVPKEVLVEEDRSVELNTESEQEIYYVYSSGKILLSTPFVTEAIQAADSSMGVVIGNGQKYIWRRGRKSSQDAPAEVTVDTSFAGSGSTARCLTSILQIEGSSVDVEGMLNQGETPKQILTEALADYKVIDLTGCSVNQILYYVSLGTPIFSIVNNEAVLIVGYDEHNVILYNPQTNATYKMGQQDSNTMFQSAGNVFLGYIE